MMNKRGAIELSMTTIIVIVIGITILSLGLVWIRSTFTQVGELTSGAFEQGEAEIGEIFGGTDAPVALSPSETSLSQGETGSATLAINNLGSGSVTAKASVEAKSSGGGTPDSLVCAMGDTFTSDSNSYTLSSGQGAQLKILIEDKGSDLGTYICVVTVTGLSEGTQTTSLIINIEK